MASFFSSLTVTEWKALDYGISKATNDISMLPSKNDQIKVSQETENESNTGFGHALMPSYIAMHSQKAAFFFRFWKQP